MVEGIEWNGGREEEKKRGRGSKKRLHALRNISIRPST